MRKYLFHILLTLLFFVTFKTTLQAQAAKDTLSFIHIKSGMSQSTISALFEDSQGFLWVGTTNGLNKYDGADFEVFEKSTDNKNGLTDGFIQTIYEDAATNLLIGTTNGLNIYNRTLDFVKPYPFKLEGNQIQSKSIHSILEKDGYLWLGTERNGLYRYNISTGKTKKLDVGVFEKGKPDDNHVIDVFQLPNNKLLMVTQGSKYIIDERLQIKERFQSTRFTSSALMLGPSTFAFGSQGGDVVRFDVIDDHLVVLDSIHVKTNNTITALEKDNHGNLWVAIENFGLSLYNYEKSTLSIIKSDYRKPNSISGGSIRTMFKASDGTMWLGYFRKGLSFYNSDHYKFEHFKLDPFNSKSLSNDLVNCFSEDEKGNIWIGTDGGGLSYWDRKQRAFEHYSLDNGKLNTNVVISILQDDKNQLWVGSWANGLALFDLETMKYEVWTQENSFLASNNIRDMLIDQKGRIWIACFAGGLQIYDPKTKEYKNISLKSKDGNEEMTIARLFEDDNGHIWVGTLGGVFKLSETKNNWSYQLYSTLSNRHFLSNDYVNTITEDDYGNLWVGTEVGLNKYLPAKDTFIVEKQAKELENEAIKGILQDEYGHLWLSTGAAGIVRYDYNTHRLSNYGSHDGLQGKEFIANSSYKTSQYNMLFGGNNGFNIFTANQAKKNTDIPKIVISELKIFNKPVRPDDSFGVLKENISQVDSITLRHNQSVIEFEFGAITFRNAQNVEYAYFLDGFEMEWNYVGNKTTATYTNLNSGKYVFRLKSTNSDGVWSNQEKTVFITIMPPYWQTWWFRLLIAGVILMCITIAFKIRMRNSKIYQDKLEGQIKERTKELELQKKKLAETADELSEKNEEIQRFTYAVSHDLKSPLNNIRGIAELIPLELDSEDTTGVEKCLELIDTSCDIMSNLIADVTEIAKLGKIENKNELLNTDDIMSLIGDLSKGKRDAGSVQLHIASDLPNIYGDKNRIIQVFGNLVDNAIKYMGDEKQPKVMIEALETDCRIIIKVTDNGSGMDEESLKKLFSPFKRFHSDVKGTGLGLYMTKQIVESHGGQISAESPGKDLGTSFSVTFPTAEISMKNEKEIQNLLEVVKA